MQLTDNMSSIQGLRVRLVCLAVASSQDFPQLFVAYSMEKLGKPGNEATLRVSLVCLAVTVFSFV